MAEQVKNDLIMKDDLDMRDDPAEIIYDILYLARTLRVLFADSTEEMEKFKDIGNYYVWMSNFFYKKT